VALTRHEPGELFPAGKGERGAGENPGSMKDDAVVGTSVKFQ